MTDQAQRNNKFTAQNIYEVWRAAEIILLEKQFDNLVAIDENTLEYQAKDSCWPAKGMRFTICRGDDSMCFEWKSTSSTYKVIMYFDGKIPEASNVDFALNVIKQVYDTYGLICAEVSGIIRLLTPFIVSVKDYGNFETLMGYSVSSLFTGICPTGYPISEVRDTYEKLIAQILPGQEPINLLFKALRDEADMVIALLNVLSNGWKLAKRERDIRLKTPDGATFDLSMLNIIHIAAKDPTLCVDLSKLLKSV